MFHFTWQKVTAIVVFLASCGSTVSATPINPSSQTKQIAAATQSQFMFTSRNLAEYLKSHVVQVINGYEVDVHWAKTGKTYKVRILMGTGSAFFINSTYLITNHHVTTMGKPDEAYGFEEYVFDAFINDRIKNGEIQESADRAEIMSQLKLGNQTSIQEVRLSNDQTLPYKVLKSGKLGSKEIDLSLIQVEGVANAPALKLATSEPQSLSRIISVGFPGAVDVMFPKARATVNEGTISGKQKMLDGSEVIQMSITVSGGHSGSPVVNQKLEVVGVTTFSSGRDERYSFAIPASDVLAFLKEAGVKNEESPTSSLYQEAIALYDQGSIGQALSKFLGVQALFPYDAQVQQFITYCRQRILSKS